MYSTFCELEFHLFFCIIEGPLQKKGQTDIWLCKYVISTQIFLYLFSPAHVWMWWYLVSFIIFLCIGAETWYSLWFRYKICILIWIIKQKTLLCAGWLVMFEWVVLQITSINFFYCSIMFLLLDSVHSQA